MPLSTEYVCGIFFKIFGQGLIFFSQIRNKFQNVRKQNRKNIFLHIGFCPWVTQFVLAAARLARNGVPGRRKHCTNKRTQTIRENDQVTDDTESKFHTQNVTKNI